MMLLTIFDINAFGTCAACEGKRLVVNEMNSR